MRNEMNDLRASSKKKTWAYLLFTRCVYPSGKRINKMLLKPVLPFLLLVLFTGCGDDIDKHYDRPSWLEGSVYTILKDKGTFTMYLECVDKTLYSQILKGSGNYTVFAPNDEAFAKFMSQRGYNTVADIPVEELNKIMGYSLIYNKFESTHLGDVLSNGQWLEGSSIKKRTAYYKTIYKEIVNGQEEWVIDFSTEGSGVYTPYKYLPVFTASYFSANGLTAADYNHFYPDVTFTGLNIPGGHILEKDMYAENGIIHEVDVVPYPLQNLDEMLHAEENASFKGIMDYQIDGSYLFAKYYEVKELTEAYKKLYPDKNIGSLFVKLYQYIAFLPNVEEFMGRGSGTTEQEGYTLFVPGNAAVDEFVNTRLLKYAHSLTELSPNVLLYFLNAHLIDALVWPSGFKAAQNANSEFFNASGASGPAFEESGITCKQVASNGLIYNIDHVIKSKYFETVYSEILLNPAYTMMNTVLTTYFASSLYEDLMKSPITGYMEENYTILLPSNELLKADGYSYDEIKNAFSNSALLGSINAEDRIKRLIRMCVFKRIKNSDINAEIADFNGSPAIGYDGYGYAVNDYGDMIRFKDGKIQAVGNMLDNEWVQATEVASLINGKVFTIDKLLQFSSRKTKPMVAAGWEDQTMYNFIKDYVAKNPDASVFKQYLDKTLYTSTDGTIAGLNTSGFYTVLIPQNDKMQEAIQKGYLPKLTDVVDTKPDSIAKASNFISACFLLGTVVPDDGVMRIMPGNYSRLNMSTVYKVNEPSIGLISEKTTIEVIKENGRLKFVPKNIASGLKVQIQGVNEATILRDVNKSNCMGPRAVIHAIDNFLAFKVNTPR